MKILSKLWDRLLDLLFPKSDEAKRLEALEFSDLRTVLPPARLSAGLESVYPLFDYGHPLVRSLVWEIKYRGNDRFAEAAAELMAEDILDKLSDIELFEPGSGPLLVPVPASRERREERGFNQTELIARKIHRKGLSETLVLVPNALAKTRHTRPQTELSREERLQNLAGAFAVTTPLLVRDRHVFLIDDVVTTGATVGEARKALMEAGARSVIAFTVAH